MTCRPGCLPPQKPILMTQIRRIRKEVYSGAGDLRRPQAPVLENHFNISDVLARLHREEIVGGKGNCGISGDMWFLLRLILSVPMLSFNECQLHTCSFTGSISVPYSQNRLFNFNENLARGGNTGLSISLDLLQNT